MTQIIQQIGIEKFLILTALLFSIGLSGIFINRKNLISLLMSIELMLLSVNINFIVFSAAFNDLTGQVFTIFILTVAAAEAAVGLAILINYFNQNKNIAIQEFGQMKG